MKQITLTQVKQWATLTVIVLGGFLAVWLLLGDENPNQPLSAVQWLAVKSGALVLAASVWRLAVWAKRNNLIPEPDDSI